jgi:hypothetical protein
VFEGSVRTASHDSPHQCSRLETSAVGATCSPKGQQLAEPGELTVEEILANAKAYEENLTEEQRQADGKEAARSRRRIDRTLAFVAGRAHGGRRLRPSRSRGRQRPRGAGRPRSRRVRRAVTRAGDGGDDPPPQPELDQQALDEAHDAGFATGWWCGYSDAEKAA